MKNAIFSVTVIFVTFLSMAALGAEFDEGMRALKSEQYSEALKILVPLANSGNDEAQRVIGEMCYNGQGMKRDVDMLPYLQLEPVIYDKKNTLPLSKKVKKRNRKPTNMYVIEISGRHKRQKTGDLLRNTKQPFGEICKTI